jgi:hypothetical protein
MSVREVGLMVTGLAVVRQQYTKKIVNGETNPLLRNGLLTAIGNFATDVFQDQLEIFQMKDNAIVILSGRTLMDGKEETLLTYAVCDRQVRHKSVREALKRIYTAFSDKFPEIERQVLLTKYEGFAQVIDKILGDLVLRPQDRVGRLL